MTRPSVISPRMRRVGLKYARCVRLERARGVCFKCARYQRKLAALPTFLLAFQDV